MKTPTIAELLKDHVTLRVECVDRFYLNGYVRAFQTTGGLVNYLAQRCVAPNLHVQSKKTGVKQDFKENRALRTRVAALLGVAGEHYTPAQMSYDLRRLRLKGILFRRHGSSRCYLSPYGLRVSLFLTRRHAHLLRPALDQADAEVQAMLQHHHFPLAQAA